MSFVVSGGRHSSSGASSTEGGLVIDLAKMRRVDVDPQTRTVRVQGGCVWKDVDQAAAVYDLATVGGTVNHTGVAGLTLGGGYGWLSGRHGLTIDNLLEVQMVLATGQIVTVSEEHLPDLFWAVRGAGHSFGVAVEFTFRVYEQKNLVWAGQLGFAITELDGVVEFANNLIAGTNGDSAMVMGITAPPFTGGTPGVVATVFHNGPETAARPIFQKLLALGPIVNTVKERPYEEVNGMMNHAVEYGGRKLSKGATFQTPLQAGFVRSLLPELEHLHRTASGSRKSILLFEFFKPDRWCAVPSDATAFAHRGRHQNLMIGPFWDSAEDDGWVRIWSRSIAKLARQELERQRRAPGQADEVITEYGNYDHLAANPRNVFGSNLDRLCELKQKYDPENVFDKSYALQLHV